MPACDLTFFPTGELITSDEIINVVKTGLSFGINKIRLTGGEPLVRGDILEIVNGISQTEGVEDLAMTTNGVLLEKYANSLKMAGLKRINVSLDTLNEKHYRQITRGGDLNKVLKGIEAARSAGLDPVKINTVRFPDTKIHEIDQIKKYCSDNNLEIRFIRQMNLRTGEFSQVDGGYGGNCSICNRLRLMANGMIKPCLFGDLQYNIRELGIVKALEMATENKPICGKSNNATHFYNVGG